MADAAARVTTRKRPGRWAPAGLTASCGPRETELERHRLARDLHDNVIQQILAAGLTIEWCLGEVPAGSPVHRQLQHAKRLTGAAARELRSSLRQLTARPGADQPDLPELLRQMVEHHGAGRVRLSLRVTGTAVTLPAAVREAARRIASECLFNCAMHGHALRADLCLRYDRDQVTLTVADDGRGDAAALRSVIDGEIPGLGAGYHTGLADLAAIVGDLGGTLQVMPSALGGVAVTATLPAILAPRERECAGG